MAYPTVNPIAKTSTELRRSIGRMEVFKQTNPEDSFVMSGGIRELIKLLQDAQNLIPEEFKDKEEAQ